MQVHRTIKYRWYTISESYKIKCQACGKAYERTANRGYNELASTEDRSRYRHDLRAEAVRLSQASDFICDSCRKGKLKQSSPVPVEDLVSLDVLPAVRDLLARQAAINEEKRDVVSLFSPHRHRIFLHKGEEYAQSGCGFDYHDDRFSINGYRINKRQPWLTTDVYVSAPLEEVTYLDDTLTARKAAATGKPA